MYLFIIFSGFQVLFHLLPKEEEGKIHSTFSSLEIKYNFLLFFSSSSLRIKKREDIPWRIRRGRGDYSARIHHVFLLCFLITNLIKQKIFLVRRVVQRPGHWSRWTTAERRKQPEMNQKRLEIHIYISLFLSLSLFQYLLASTNRRIYVEIPSRYI